jgi:hypothetical protein
MLTITNVVTVQNVKVISGKFDVVRNGSLNYVKTTVSFSVTTEIEHLGIVSSFQNSLFENIFIDMTCQAVSFPHLEWMLITCSYSFNIQNAWYLSST